MTTSTAPGPALTVNPPGGLPPWAVGLLAAGAAGLLVLGVASVLARRARRTRRARGHGPQPWWLAADGDDLPR